MTDLAERAFEILKTKFPGGIAHKRNLSLLDRLTRPKKKRPHLPVPYRATSYLPPDGGGSDHPRMAPHRVGRWESLGQRNERRNPGRPDDGI